MTAPLPERLNTDHGHRFDASRRWDASLELGFIHSGGATRLKRCHHHGPLRVQRPFYPEGEVCHVYLLHPPGGLVSGDRLAISAHVAEGAQALLTTPAAAKLYRADSHGVAWQQHTRLDVEDGGLLEWLPQETIAFDGSKGRQSVEIALSGNARCLGWEAMALGRPASRLPFESGRIEQHFRLVRDGRPLWIERQPLDPHHPRFHGRWGQGGHAVQATLWAVGLPDMKLAVETLREHIAPSTRWAVTVRLDVLLLRYLGDELNEARALCHEAWALLRPLLAGREACPPRIWFT
ncbi:urease accessory protein UreD [Phytohalomonas tamaricis]|uniref:urease accessory protein UreD n=1 Tax=Phytohalomonas tamaricis TaxID=2081032 RepID=UPI000D0B32B0|nr:urease accessory protein UreD [Phytohalomonas tamaricis]